MMLRLRSVHPLPVYVIGVSHSLVCLHLFDMFLLERSRPLLRVFRLFWEKSVYGVHRD
jgi:hypothetical protein